MRNLTPAAPAWNRRAAEPRHWLTTRRWHLRPRPPRRGRVVTARASLDGFRDRVVGLRDVLVVVLRENKTNLRSGAQARSAFTLGACPAAVCRVRASACGLDAGQGTGLPEVTIPHAGCCVGSRTARYCGQPRPRSNMRMLWAESHKACR